VINIESGKAYPSFTFGCSLLTTIGQRVCLFWYISITVVLCSIVYLRLSGLLGSKDTDDVFFIYCSAAPQMAHETQTESRM